MSDKKNIVGLSSEYKESFSRIAVSKDYPMLKKFLKTQQNNIAIFEWFRIKSNDPDISRKKAYYEGQFDFIKYFLDIFDNIRKTSDEEE